MDKLPVKLKGELESLYRPQSEYLRQSSGDKFLLGGSLAFAGLLAAGVLSCALFLALHDRASVKPAAEVSDSGWKVLYGLPYGACGDGSAAPGPGCPIAGALPALWASMRTLADADHSQDMPAAPGATVWLGFRLEAGALRAAAAERANIIALGMPRGRCRVWLDGSLVYEDGGSPAGAAPFLQVPFSRLTSSAPLEIAVELVPQADPGGPLSRRVPSGLMTRDQAASLQRSGLLWTQARPLALAGMNIVLAGLLCLIWLPGTERREYLFLALLAAFHALNQLKGIDLVSFLIPTAVLHGVGYVTAMIQAGLPAFAGFAFARMGAWTYRRGLPALLLAGAAGSALAGTTAARAAASENLLLWGTLAAALAGALACLGQAYALRGRPGAPRARMRRLLAFSAGLALLGLSALFETGGSPHYSRSFFFERTLNIPLMLFLTYLALQELRETKRLAANSPASSYHRRAELPAVIDGCVLMLDFKGSEKLFRLGTRLGIGGELVAKALTEAWGAVSAAGGEVLQTEGDALTAMLERKPDETDSGLLARTVAALVAVRAALNGLAVSYRARDLLTQGENIEFRAACSPGFLRPAWREIGNTRQPFWLESGGSNVLVDTARLLELEREVPGNAGESRLVYPAGLPGPGEEYSLDDKRRERHRVRVLTVSQGDQAGGG